MRFPIKLPPGISRNGTEFSSAGHYYDAWHVRWTDDGTLKPTGGWRLRNSATAALTGSPRALQTWKDNTATTWIQIGTHSHLYVSNRAGAIFDITPAGFTSGRADATAGGGYGTGTYGTGTYGTPRPDSSLILDATQWTMDTFGQNPFAVSPDDGFIYTWDLVTADIATKVTNAPTCAAVVVTPERFVFALGSSDPRTVQWSDQQNSTVWTPSTTNQAGSFPLQTAGRLMCGKAVKGGTLLLTDIDAWVATYIGGTLIYAFQKIGSDCGAISRQCVAALDTQAAWMSKSGFWKYNGGYVEQMPCDVGDYVFANLNAQQISKAYCIRDSANSEVLWYYCSAASIEIDSCVVWNYKFNYWNVGRVSRLCGTGRGAFAYPIMVDSAGLIYEHEVGFAYGTGSLPYAEGGPLEFGGGYRAGLSKNVEMSGGDGMMEIDWLFPDEKTSGDTSVTFKAKNEPNGAETSYGPYSLSSETALRLEARQVKVRFTGVNAVDWRVGVPRLDVSPGGQR